MNVARLVKLPSGKPPKALVWTAEREERWKREVAGRVAEGYKLKRAREMAPTPSPVVVWRADHTGRFLDHLINDRLCAMWFIVTHRGLRRGETCGLEWSDCALSAEFPTATISRQIVRVGPDLVEDTPKSDAGEREVALGHEGAMVLKAHKARQNRERLEWGEA